MNLLDAEGTPPVSEPWLAHCGSRAAPPPTGSPWQSMHQMSTSCHQEAIADTDKAPSEWGRQRVAQGWALTLLGLPVTSLAPVLPGDPAGGLGSCQPNTGLKCRGRQASVSNLLCNLAPDPPHSGLQFPHLQNGLIAKLCTKRRQISSEVRLVKTVGEWGSFACSAPLP